MKTFEQVLLESCTKTVYKNTKGLLTEGIQTLMIQNLYTEGFKNWFLKKVRRLKNSLSSLYYSKDRREVTKATIDTFFTTDANTGKIQFRPEVLSLLNDSDKKDPLFKRLYEFEKEYNLSRKVNMNIFKRIFNGKNRFKLDALADSIIQNYAKKNFNGEAVPFGGFQNTAYAKTKLFSKDNASKLWQKAKNSDDPVHFERYGGKTNTDHAFNVVHGINQGGKTRDSALSYLKYHNNMALRKNGFLRSILRNRVNFLGDQSNDPQVNPNLRKGGGKNNK